MEKDSHFIPAQIRSYIVGQVESGFTYDQTIENVERKYSRIVTKGAISKIMDKFYTTGNVNDLPRKGAPHIYSTQQEQMIIDTVKKDRKLTGVDVARDPKLNKYEATERTIQNILNRDGLKARTSQPRSIAPTSINQRLEFASKFIDQPDIWPFIIFSDESDLFPYKSGKLFIRRYSGEKPIQYYNMYTKWDPRTIKVWGCISLFGVSPLVRFRDTMKNTTY